MSASDGGRLDWIDAWKGVLIVLVVAGHVCGGLSHVCEGWAKAACEICYKMIYFFHMPAFFWIAGLCWRTRDDSFAAFAKRRARRLLVPYAVFGVASVLVYAAASGAAASLDAHASDGYYAAMGAIPLWKQLLALVHAGGWPDGEGFRCNSVLWFLPTMFTTSCLYFWLDRLLPSRRGQLAVALLLLPAFWLCRRIGCPGLPWGLSLAGWYLPFVVFGRWLRLGDSARVRGGGAMILAGWLAYGVAAHLEPNTWLGVPKFGWFAVFTGMTVWGLALCAWSVRRLRGRTMRLFAALGLASMGVMLMHKFLVLGLQLKVPLVRELAGRGGLATCAAALAILVGATGASYVVSKLPFVRRIV